MKIAGIIAEYNPFHNGHAYHIEKTREVLNPDAVIAVMSGNFVQRGDVAICDKYTRAAAAIYGGCDLVIELPVNFSLASASRFAYGAVFLISAMNIVNYLSFGSECEDISVLKKLAKEMSSKNMSRCIKAHLNTNVSYAQARGLAARELLGEKQANILSCPNNILAIEYLAWLKKLCPTVKPLSVKRHIKGYHDLSYDYDKGIASASGIRALLKELDSDLSGLVPNQCAQLYASARLKGAFPIFLDLYDELVFSRLIRLSLGEIKNLPDVSEGLENRIFKAIRANTTLSSLYDDIKTKRYTHSRIRRIIMSAYLGLCKQSLKINPQYIRVLAFNKKGSEVIRLLKTNASLAIITKSAHINKLGPEARALFEYERLSTYLYSLGIKNKEYQSWLDDYKRMPEYIK